MNDIKIRELEKEDLWNGFLSSLDSLRKASDIEKETALKIFDKINQNPDHIVAVADVWGNSRPHRRCSSG
jgi:glucosamine-phosphate N-acetyltransferase